MKTQKRPVIWMATDVYANLVKLGRFWSAAPEWFEFTEEQQETYTRVLWDSLENEDTELPGVDLEKARAEGWVRLVSFDGDPTVYIDFDNGEAPVPVLPIDPQ